MTLNCGIQKGTVLLVALAVGVALGAVELAEVVVPEEPVVVADGSEADPDEVEGKELPPEAEGLLPLLNVEETRDPVLLVVDSPGDPGIVENVEELPELGLPGVADDEVIILDTGCERLVPVLVV